MPAHQRALTRTTQVWPLTPGIVHDVLALRCSARVHYAAPVEAAI